MSASSTIYVATSSWFLEDSVNIHRGGKFVQVALPLHLSLYLLSIAHLHFSVSDKLHSEHGVHFWKNQL